MERIALKQKELSHHPVYQKLNSVEAIRTFMSHHVFAVWDFMSLLKALQIHLTTVTLPWKPSPYPAEMVRLINQIVLGEESDLDQNGQAISHFELYLKGMEEVGASTVLIREFLKTGDMNLIPPGTRDFVAGNIEMAKSGDALAIASNFFFGREKLIPDMFESIVSVLKKENINAPTFIYYLERHIEVDSEEHGPLALKALDYLVSNDESRREKAINVGLKALEMREALWDKVLETL